MASYRIALRDLIVTAIDTAKSGYVLTTIDVAGRTHPRTFELSSNKTDLYVDVVALNNDMNFISRNLSHREEIVPIQIAFRGVAETEAEAETFAELVEQMQETTAQVFTVSGCKYRPISIEALKDDNGLPYDFARFLREAGTYESFFTTMYKTVGLKS